MKMISLLLLLTSLVFAKTYRNSNYGIVVDETNNLVWIDNETNISVYLNHNDATDYCQNLKFAGYTDWRLPTIEEFKTIVNKRNKKSFIDFAFKYNFNTGYWASKAHWRTLWFYADYMHFVSGTPYFDSRHKKKFVRCVKNIK